MMIRSLCGAALVALWSQSNAATWTLSPPEAGGGLTLAEAANRLRPGDELVIRGGLYESTERRAITCRGTPEAPIVIRAADGETPVFARPADPKHHYSRNGLEVIDSEHLVIRGLRILRGSSGIRFIRGRHVTLEGCEIARTGNNGITLNSGDTDSFVIRGNHIHHTGLLDESVGETEGEGMYVGCNGARCIASNHLIELNYIHHLRATSGGGNDGIEIKYGSHGNVVRHNVIHDTTSGRRYPGIFVYGVRHPDREAPNVVEGNIIWSAGEGIYAVADAVVRGNLVFHCDTGIASYPHAQVRDLRNVTITENIVAGSRGVGLRLRWAGAQNAAAIRNWIVQRERAVDAVLPAQGDAETNPKAPR